MSPMFDRTYTRDEVKKIQRAINECTFDVPNRVALVADGLFGAKSVELLRVYQRLKGFPVTGDYVRATAETLNAFIAKKYVTTDFIIQTSKDYGVDPIMVLALMDNESRESGFLPNTRATVLFERHKFREYLMKVKTPGEVKRLQAQRPDLIGGPYVAKGGSVNGYIGGERGWGRVDDAMRIDLESAIQACSWGLGQVMGFNWRLVGAESVMDFFTKMMTNEYEQFKLMLGFIVNQPHLVRAFNRKDYTTIAVTYNGRNHAQNRYVPRLEAAYARLSKIHKV